MIDNKGKKHAPAKGLGRGLSALIPTLPQAPVGNSVEKPTAVGGEEIHYVSLKEVIPNRFQPRRNWDDEKLKDLAQSIKETGLLQPLIVRPRPTGERNPQYPQSYELIAGERRFRALQLLGLNEAPCLVRDVDGKTSLEIAIIENIQREDLNAIDEALAYRRLLTEFKYSQEELSGRVGRDRTTVTNSLRLLNLPADIQKDLSEGLITAGHARALLSLERDQDRLSLERLIIRDGLSVRAAERMVQEAKLRSPSIKKATQRKVTPEIRFLEEGLMATLGTKVQIKHHGRRGRIEIEYYNLDDLDRLVQLLQSGKVSNHGSGRSSG